MSVRRGCKECPPNSKRAARFPGPRCYTHHKANEKARAAASHQRTVQKTYGLLPGQYEQLYRHQGGVCFVCARSNGRTKRLAVDHDHETGEVRGLLCGPCNRMVGWFRNHPEAFDRGAAYLRNPPARAVLGAPAVGQPG